MTTLAQQISKTHLDVVSGKKRYGADLQNPSLPLQLGMPLERLRESLAKVAQEAKQTFIRTIRSNQVSETVFEVQHLVPQSEPCFEFLLVLDTYGTALMPMVDEVWTPFIDWLASEGLALHISRLDRPLGVQRFVNLQVDVMFSVFESVASLE